MAIKAVRKDFEMNVGDDVYPLIVTEPRFVLVDTETGEIVDDAQGYGYKTASGAHKAYGYKKTHRRKQILKNPICHSPHDRCSYKGKF